MTDEPTLTVTSFLHGMRSWRRICVRDHRRRDGRLLVLADWESACVVCGGTFYVATSSSVTEVGQSKRFCTVTCPRHRMTPSEVGRLRFAKRENRRAVFETLKARKLETRIAEPAAPAPTPRPMDTMDPARRWRRCMSRDRLEQILRLRSRHPSFVDLTDQQVEALISITQSGQSDRRFCLRKRGGWPILG